MAYNSSTGKITAPVSFADIQAAIGNASTDLAVLCKGSNINMWAKFKPVSKQIIDINNQLNSDKTWKADSQLTDPWWTGLSGTYGLGFTRHVITPSAMVQGLNNLAATINGTLNGWTYSKPVGGTSSPFRQTDFNGYNSKAPLPARMQDTGDKDIYATSQSDWEYAIQFIEPADNGIDSRDYLVPSDMLGSSLYPGIAIYKKNGSTYEVMAWTTGKVWVGSGIASSSATDGLSGTTATFKDGATYYAIPVLFNVALDQTTPGQSVLPSGAANVVTYPYTNFLKFICHQSASLQNIGWPNLKPSRQMLATPGMEGYAKWGGSVYLNSGYSSYYHGGTTAIGVAVVNNTWNGSWGNWIAGQYAGTPVDQFSVTVPANTDQIVLTIQSSSLGNLNLQYGWYVVVHFWSTGENFKISLMPPKVNLAGSQ